MKYILSFLLCCTALAQQTVNNFTVKTNLIVGNTLVVTNEAVIDGVNIGTGAGNGAGSTRVGKNSLGGTATGTGNTAVGEGAGLSVTSGISNTLIGNNAAPFITSSGQNVVVGKDALFSATFGDTIPGTFGYTNGVHNQTVLGVNALYYLIKGRNNFAAGTFSQYQVTNGSFNVSLGTHSMNDLIAGDSNTGLGESTLWKLVSGSNNTAVGKDAGYFSTGSSSGNIYIGRNAGPTSLTTENNKLYIDNASGTPLIGADFSANTITFTGQLNQQGNLVVTSGNSYTYGDIYLGAVSYTNTIKLYQHQDGGLALQTGAPGRYYYHSFSTNGVFKGYSLASDTDLNVPGGSYLNSVSITGNTTIGSGGSQITRMKRGTATLVAGTVVVSDANVSANSEIYLSTKTAGGTPGWLRVSDRSAGVSFTALSSSGTDTSVISYLLIEP
jgi:hypothetical protein